MKNPTFRTSATMFRLALVVVLAAGCVPDGGADGPSAEADGFAGDGPAGIRLDGNAGPSAQPQGGQGAQKAHESALVGGIGSLTVGDDDQQRPLELRSLVVHASASAEVAELAVEHVFHNPSADRLQGIFRFPVPADAIVTGLSMEVDGRMVQGEIVARRKAEKIYRDIVDSMRDPALLRWQGGGTLELRVFPVEPHADKRIVLTMLVPAPAPWGASILRYGTASDRVTHIGRFAIVRGQETLVERTGLTPGEAFTVTLDDVGQDSVFTQAPSGPGGDRFLAVRVTAGQLLARDPTKQPIAALGVRPTARGRSVAVVVDRSRSSLEARQLQRDVVAAITDSLGPDDRFALAASDIACRPSPIGWFEARSARGGEALRWLDGVDAEGATDLGVALDCAADLVRKRADHRAVQVVYVGDGIATWGELDLAVIAARAKRSLQGALWFAAAVGKATDLSALRTIATATGGAAQSLSDRAAVGRFAGRLAHLVGLVGAAAVRVDCAGCIVHPGELGTLYPGDVRHVLVRLPHGVAQPGALTVSGLVAGARRTAQIGIPTLAPPARYLRARFGAAHIADLQGEGAPAEQVVHASQKYGVLSKETALLVLESEEAYKQHGIERLRGPADSTRVSGADLESIGSGDSVSPDRIQPGDPEIRVRAPRDAHSVTASLPWNERLALRWEPAGEHGPAAWVGRFLVDRAVPHGRYPIAVHIEHRDGRIEHVELFITVDTSPPVVRVSIRAHRRLPGTFVVRGRQLGEKDARGVELRMPDGQVIALTAVRLGRFVGRWTPTRPVTWPVVAEGFAIDRALNQTTGPVVWQGPGAAVRIGDGQLAEVDMPLQRGHVEVPKVGMDVTALAAVPGVGIMAGTLTDGLWLRRGESWRRLPVPGVDRRINRLAVQARADDGVPVLWVATARGAAAIAMPSDDPSSWQVRTHGVSEVWSLLPDAGVLGTAKGLMLLGESSRPATVVGVKQGLPVRAVWDLARAGDGAVWLASSWGAYRLAPDMATEHAFGPDIRRFRRFSVATGDLRDDWVTALAVHGDDVLVGTYKGGVTRLHPVGYVGWQAVHIGGQHINLGGLTVGADLLVAATMQGPMQVDLRGVSSGAHGPASMLAPIPGRMPHPDATAVMLDAGTVLIGTRSGVVARR